MPTDLFYTVDFSIIIIASILAIMLSILTIIIFLINHQCRTITNLMACNTAMATIFYFLTNFISAVYGLRGDWADYQSVCAFRAYCLTASCAAICYSHLMQAISRLFFVIFYKKRFLLQWRIHWLMIIANWLISMTIAIVPFFLEDAYSLERESRICAITSKIFSASLYTTIAVYLIPFSIIVVIYTAILYKARQSTRRVMPAVTSSVTAVTTNNNPMPNIKREIQLIKIMLVLIGAMTFAGTLYLILIFWHLIRPQPAPPQPLYLLGFNSISISTAFMTIALFWLNKDVRKCAFRYLRILY